MFGILILFLRHLDPGAWDAGGLLSSPGAVSASQSASPAPLRDRRDSVSHAQSQQLLLERGPRQAGMAPAPTAESTPYWVPRARSPHAQGLITTLLGGAICFSPLWPLCQHICLGATWSFVSS